VAVLTVNVDETVPAPGVTVLGEKVHFACAGKPPQLKLTAFENDPPTEETFTL
jgi:hypothetical protein